MAVLSVADARAALSRLIATLRDDPAAPPVTIGSHRKPEAVLMSIEAYQRLAHDRQPIVTTERLRQLKPVIDRLANAAHLHDVRIYGSVARGDQSEQSDLDLLVTPADEATLFDLAQFEIDMEVLLGIPVSAVSVASLDSARDARLLAEAVSL